MSLFGINQGVAPWIPIGATAGGALIGFAVKRTLFAAVIGGIAGSAVFPLLVLGAVVASGKSPV